MIFAAALAGCVAAFIALPHLAPLERAAPAVASALWVVSLGLRALAGVFVSVYLVLFLPETAAFSAVTHWCWHAIVPVVAKDLGISGHHVGHAATALPVLALALSVISVALGVLRAAREVRRVIAHKAIGLGPRGSVIVGGDEVTVAAAGIAHPRLVVSAGALVALDEAELAAGLAHEQGHIVRGHRYLMLYAELCSALGCFLPGRREALRQLAFDLERDADAWVVRRRYDPVALASAICKSALSRTATSPAFASLDGSGEVTRRVSALLAEPAGGRAGGCRVLPALAAVGAALTIGLTAAVPPTIAAGGERHANAPHPRHCAE